MANAVGHLSMAVKAVIVFAMAAEVALIISWHPIQARDPAPPPARAASALADPVNEAAKIGKKVPDRVLAPEPDPNQLITIEDPEVGPDGSISGGAAPFFLAEISRFTSKDVCTRASGERWACGLHAYATLRNSIAHKTIQCTPAAGPDAELLSSCRLDERNLSALLLRDGLAQLRDGIDDEQLLRVQADAKLKRTGIWDR